MSNADRSNVVAVVLNWCTERETQACTSTLLADPALSVLVVDNASPDGSGDRLRAWVESLGANVGGDRSRVSFLQTGANLGYAGGNACGVHWALERAADWVLVINPDTQPEPTLVAALLQAADSAVDGRVGAVCPTLLDLREPARATYAGGRFDVKRALGKPRTGLAAEVAPREGAPSDVSFLHGGCVLLRAEALRDVGGFCEDFFMYVEDAELSLRLKRAGWRLIHQPKARILHAGDEFGDPIAWKIFLRDRNRRKLVAEHYTLSERLRFWLWFYPTRFGHLFRYLAQADTPRARAVLRAMFSPLDAEPLLKNDDSPNRNQHHEK